MWERGLKLNTAHRRSDHITVAPHVGAGIETSMSSQRYKRWNVAPHVGAWIETETAENLRGVLRRSPCGSVD